MLLSSLTALDIAGVRPRRQADGNYHHACVACGGAAKTGSWHSQCSDPSCSSRVLSPLDTLALGFGGSHARAAEFANDRLRRKVVTADVVAQESTRRMVLDFWISKCLRQPPTMKTASQTAALKAEGWLILPSQKGMAVLTGKTITDLVALADLTGADFPDAMRNRAPESAIAYAVQTTPHTIDRIVITTGKGQECAIVWARKRAGIVGLLCMTDDHLLASDYRAAMKLQGGLSNLGSPREVAAVFLDHGAPSFREKWRPDLGRLTSVVAGSGDVVTLAAFHDAFPLTSDTVPSVYAHKLLSMDGATPISWTAMRRSYLAAAIGKNKRELGLEALNMLDQALPTREEVAWLIQLYLERGEMDVAEDIKRHMDNRVIYKDSKVKVRETASEYLLDYGDSTSTIANFALHFTHNLFFRDQPDLFHAARIMYGRTSLNIIVPASAIDNVNELQKAIRTQMILHSKEGLPEQLLPTIAETSAMRRHVIPYLKRQVSKLKSKEGFCSLGWTKDRSMFVGPGVRITMNGLEHGPVDRHPNTPHIRHFDSDCAWDGAAVENLPLPARDLIAMMLASCARYFVQGVTKPVCVQHSPAARHLLTTMFRSLGQKEIFELNPNLRDPSNTHGVNGYPLLTTGYNAAQVAGARFGHVLLTDTGYSVTEEVDQEAAEAAGRSLQFGLVRLAEWCLATRATDFSEVPALYYNSSLLREGRWLVENVCDLQPWEVSDLGLAHLESLLSMIPQSDTAKRLSLRDGTELTADLSGLEWDRDSVYADLRTLKSRCEGEGDSLVMGAVEVLPAMELYYGRAPEVSITL